MSEEFKNLGNMIAEGITKGLAPVFKHDLPSGYSISTNQAHGSNGIFGVMGLDQSIFSTRVSSDGLMGRLPVRFSNDTHPVFGYLTGFTAGTGDEPEGPCDQPPEAGEMKSGFQGAPFGRVPRKTKVVDLSNAGERINRGEFYDLVVENDPILRVAELLLPPSIGRNARQAMASEVAGKMIALGIEFEDVLSHMLWTGSPANNTASNGYMEFVGLETLVATTHTDVFTSSNLPALASDVRDFNYGTIEDNAAQVFAHLTSMWRVANTNARRMNMNPVEFAFVMREEIFRELTDYWPCVYASYRCGSDLNVSNNVEALEMRREAMDMYNSHYLMIDGQRVPVIPDDALPAEYNGDEGNVDSGAIAGDIYLMPLRARNTPVLYMEFFNFNAPGAAMDIVRDAPISPLITSDGGAWLWTEQQTVYCVDWIAVAKPRVVFRTPHLAARLQNVVANPLKFARQPFADDPYFVNGGSTSGISGALPYDYSDYA